jgi:hypothetical protein
MKISRTTLAALAAATMLAGAAGAAQAASIFGNGINNIIYHNYENVFDSNGNQKLSTVAAPAGITVGDTIVGVLRFDGVTYSGGSYTPSTTNEVTGIFAQKVVAITGAVGGVAVPGSIVYYGAATRTTFANGADTFSTGLVGNEMFKLWNQTGAADFNAGIPTATTMATSVATATNGSLIMSLGFANTGAQDSFVGDLGYFYSTVALDASSHPQITSFAGLNIINNAAGVNVTKIDDPGESFANGGVFNVDLWLKSGVGLDFVTGDQTQLNKPWDYISSDPAQISVFVPLPAAAWTGLTMLAAMGGIAALRRRKTA